MKRDFALLINEEAVCSDGYVHDKTVECLHCLLYLVTQMPAVGYVVTAVGMLRYVNIPFVTRT